MQTVDRLAYTMRTLQDRIAECMRRRPDLSQADIARATVVAEDLPLDLRDYKAKQELLTALCDAIAAHVEERFRPSR